eukprot:TRINITY_DN4948_c0_g1_i1.p1 TRINITY_DN4948_c0_g1~~TRINITY_DN4948_c0_g1_i1.p1  ORF type:complete len:191 (-),score=24.46 TRINITY_DN4948_c0_g1_i1:42-614(-)
MDLSSVGKTLDNLKEFLVQDIKTRYISKLNRVALDLVYLACALDPRSKDLKFMTQSDQDATWNLLQTQLKSILVTASSSPPKKKAKLSFMDTVFSSISPIIADSDEFIAFRKEPSIPHDYCPFLWWKNHKSEYPNLARLAKRILAIPGTSVGVERLFSKAGDVVNKNRNRLNPKNVTQHLMLHDNKRFLK